MESFKGNGAECMVQFIKDGCKGSVCHRAPDGKGTAPVLVNRHIWENAYATDHLGWLATPCEYYPPEQVYRNATPGEALDAWLNGRTVQRRANEYDTVANGEWYSIGAKNSDMPFSRWGGTETEYRIKEE